MWIRNRKVQTARDHHPCSPQMDAETFWYSFNSYHERSRVRNTFVARIIDRQDNLELEIGREQSASRRARRHLLHSLTNAIG